MPRTTLKTILGVFATSLLAGPSVLVASILAIGLSRLVNFDGQPSVQPEGTMEGFLAWALGSIAMGVWIATPASLINAIALNSLASRARDSIRVAVLVGTVGGIIVLGVLLSMSLLPPPFTPFATIVTELPEQIAVVVTGVLMSVVYWLVAIRPRRSARLASNYTY